MHIALLQLNSSRCCTVFRRAGGTAWPVCCVFLIIALLLLGGAARGVPDGAASLSPLQAYLYSRAAAADTVVLTYAATSSESSTGSTSQQAHHAPETNPANIAAGDASRHRLVLPAQAGNDATLEVSWRSAAAAADAAASAPSSSFLSSSSRSGTAVGVSSLAASLAGRYVVLSRSTLAASSLRTLSSERGGPAPLSGSYLNQSMDEDNNAASVRLVAPLAYTRQAHRARIFPEEALQRVAVRASAYRVRTHSDIGSGAHQAEALREEGLQLSDLEVHVIDAAHILVYLPASEASVALLRALADDGEEDAEGGAASSVSSSWRVWDAFRSARGGPLLKMSDTLRGVLQGTPQAYPVAESILSGSVAAMRMRYEVALWTARGRAAAVYADVLHSARLQRYMATPAVTAVPTCQLLVEEVPAADADVVWLHVDVVSTLLSDGFSSSAASMTRAPPVCLREALLAVSAHPAVRWVEEAYRRPEKLNNVATRILQHGSCSTYLNDSLKAGGAGMTPLWDSGFDGSGEVIAIADSGVDTESCYFRDAAESVAYYPKLNPRHRKILSYLPYVDGDGVVDATDKPDGHGTHVAGTAAGCALPSSGGKQAEGSSYNGVATGAKLFVRDMNAGAKKTLFLPSNLREIFEVAESVGAHVCSNSWGFGTSSQFYLAMEKMFDTAVAERRTFLAIAAVSNSGTNNVFIPGRAKNVLTVGSHHNSLLPELHNTVPDSSGFGTTYDHRRKPDFVAPGGGGGGTQRTVVTSAKAKARQVCATTTSAGTSMATAAAAGAAAVVRQYLRVQWGLPDPSSALLRAALLHSTTPAMPVAPIRRGFGRLDLSLLLPHRNSTLRPSLPPPPAHWFLDDAVVHDDETLQYCFAIPALPGSGVQEATTTTTTTTTTGGEDACGRTASLTVKATLVWNDPGTAVEGSSFSQVHDLDLMLVTAHGHTFFSGPDGTTRERYSTAEQVRVPIAFAADNESSDTPAATSATEWRWGFRVLVHGDVVRSAAGQSFALAVTGPGLVALPTCPALFREWRTAAAAAASRTPSAATEGFGSAATCPMNCSLHGTCDPTSLLCACDARYTSVDCSECNADVLCNGRGTCDTQTMTCTCDPRGHFADGSCTTCAKGWFGPDCASDCSCLHGGVCNQVTGLCSCVQDRSMRQEEGTGCFQGAQCQYCCDGFGGAGCNQRSYWCNETGTPVVVDNPAGGFIQINGFDTYGYSLTCRWAIRAQRGQQVHLEFLNFQMEAADVVTVYDVVPNTAPSTTNAAAASGAEAWQPMRRQPLRRVSGGMSRPEHVITSTGEQMDVEFVSDWEGTDRGFILYYRFSSCSERCKVSNLTGPVGHWRCGDAFGLPTQQCICEPPYVGWNCNEDASDISELSRELDALDISHKRAWQDGELAWILPRSVLTAAEVRLPVHLLSPTSAAATETVATTTIPSDTTTSRRWTLPVEGWARLPLVVHGFSEVQLPLLTLPTPAFLPQPDNKKTTEKSTPPRRRVTAYLRLAVQMQVEPAWLDNDAAALGLALGVSAATDLSAESPALAASVAVAKSGPSLFQTQVPNGGTGGVEGSPVVQYNDTAAALTLNAFTFTPMALQKLAYCADVPVVELTVPLNLLANVSNPITRAAQVTPAADSDSHWTMRVVFTLLWRDVAGLNVPNVSVVDAVVMAQEVVVLETAASLLTATGDALPAAGSTVRGKPVQMSCHAIARVPVRTGGQVVKAASARAASTLKVSSTVRFVVLFCALCVGVVGGMLWALWWSPDRHRSTYVAVQTTEEGQDMQLLGKRN